MSSVSSAPLADLPVAAPLPLLNLAPTRYALCGYVIDTDYPLITLERCPETAGPLGTIILRVGDVPEHIDHANVALPGIEVSPRAVLLKAVEGSRPLGWMLARDGSEIIVAPEPGAESELEPYILGSGVGAICLQNGFLPLHASAVVHDGDVIAFAGVSGAGKSTMGAAMAARGCQHVTDDLAVLKIAAHESPTLYPGPRTIKLAPDSYWALGFDPANGALMSPHHDKMRFTSSSALRPAQALKLAAIYLLELSDDEEVTIEPVAGIRATAALAGEIYRSGWLGPMEIFEVRMRDIAMLARRTPCFRLRRSHRLDQLPKVVDAVLKHRETLAEREVGA